MRPLSGQLRLMTAVRVVVQIDIRQARDCGLGTGAIEMIMKLEWVIEQARSGLLRLDIDLPDHRHRGGDEAFHLVVIRSFWDEEGSSLGYLEVSGRGQGPISVSRFVHEDKDALRLTRCGELTHDWVESWKTEAERVIRIGVPNERRGERVYRNFGAENWLVMQQLLLALGAASQFEQMHRENRVGTVDGRSALGVAVDYIRDQIRRANHELALFLAYLPDPT